ncbi:sodium:calcium antiporter [Candidatus Woesearchaeota archaeon]|nr:sodium:calcium antiporter [Candidatus Woesearchaeota archaeon]
MVIISQNPIDNLIIGAVAVVFLVFVADKVIGISIRLGRKLGISQIFIGLTVIAVGTSLPEITTSVVASLDILEGKIDPLIASGTVLGTNIGSDIVQQSLIIGIVGLLAAIRLRTIHIKRSFIREDCFVMIAAAILLLLFALDGKISRVEGAVLFFGYLAFLWFLWIKEDNRIHDHMKFKIASVDKKNIFIDLSYIIAGLVVIIFSAEYILRVAEFFVLNYNVGSSLIGVLIIGVATALPELTTSITAMFRGASSISIGTLIGSNITNPMFALGMGAMISSYQVPRPVIVYDLPVKIASSIVLVWFLWRNRMFTKKEAMTMITIYFVYALVRLKYFSADL